MLIQTRSAHKRNNTLKTYYNKIHLKKLKQIDQSESSIAEFRIINIKRELHWLIMKTQLYDFLTYPDKVDAEIYPGGKLKIENFHHLKFIQSRENEARSVAFLTGAGVNFTVTSKPITDSFFQPGRPIICTLQAQIV